MITALDFEIDTFARLVTARLRADPGYVAIQAIPGVGPLLGAVFVAEIGDIGRFARAEQLASWAGLTPKHHESDTTVHRGRITSRDPDQSTGPAWSLLLIDLAHPEPVAAHHAAPPRRSDDRQPLTGGPVHQPGTTLAMAQHHTHHADPHRSRAIL